MSKILVLNGSPRKDGNSARMVEEFVKGATEKGHEVFVENIACMNIKGCLACEYCHSKGEGECIQNDDMQKLYPILKEIDTLVFASPVYYFTLSAQLQSVIQRTYALWSMKNIKQCAMILSSESSGVFDAIETQYKNIISWWGAKDKGIILAPSIHFKEDTSTRAKTKLEEVYNLGKNI